MELLELQPEIELESSEDFKANPGIIERRRGAELTYNEFYWKYMKANIPVVLTDVSNDWECRRNWIKDTTKGEINMDYLRNITDQLVPVADCGAKYFNSHAKLEMKFHDFLDHWSKSTSDNNKAIIAAEENANVVQQATTKRILYLKDWHLKMQLPEYNFYQVPKHFASDWLNEYLMNKKNDDYRFVYMGPKGTWTPFHADVFGSYSWSTNIVGCKKWLLLPPGEELKLVAKRELPFAINEKLLTNKGVKFLVLFQQANEALFVPSGWYHQVTNETDTISINHNWFNACNLGNIWNNLTNSMRDVIAEIEDCRQMDNFSEHCQTMLRASFGINYEEFIDILEYITEQRLTCLNGNHTMSSNILSFGQFAFNNFHIRHDIDKIQTVLEAMIQDTIVSDSPIKLYNRCNNLLETIKREIN